MGWKQWHDPWQDWQTWPHLLPEPKCLLWLRNNSAIMTHQCHKTMVPCSPTPISMANTTKLGWFQAHYFNLLHEPAVVQPHEGLHALHALSPKGAQTGDAQWLLPLQVKDDSRGFHTNSVWNYHGNNEQSTLLLVNTNQHLKNQYNIRPPILH